MSNIIKEAKISPEPYILQFEKIIIDKIEEKKTTEDIAKIILKNREKQKEDIINEAEEKASKILQEATLKAEEIIKNSHKYLEDKEKSLFEKIKNEEERLNLIKKIVQDEQSKIPIIKEDAYKEGYLSGERKGLEEIKEKMKIKILDVEEKVSKIQGDVEEIIRSAYLEKEKITSALEKDILNLSLDIAKKILKEETKLNKELVIQIAREAIKKVIGKDKAKIRVNPEDIEKIESHKAELMRLQEEIKNLDIEGDVNIEKGSLVVETSSGNVDARISTQIEEVEKNLLY